MGMPSLGRTVLELATDSSGFYSEIDKAERRVVNLGGVFDKAGAKVATMGTSAGRSAQQVNQSFDGIERSASKLGTSIGAIGGTLAKAFAITAVIGAVKSFTDLTGQIADLSAKTGIGTTALQKLKLAAEQSGGSLEQTTSAITQMGRRLVEGDTGAVNALSRLGLSLDTLRKTEPGAAFAEIADKIATIPSPMERAKLAMDLFGKSGADLLPMMTGNMRELGEQAENTGLVLGEDVVAAGDAFGDTLGTLFTAGMAVLGKVLTPFLPLLQKLAEWATVAAGILGDVLGGALRVIFNLGSKVLGWLTGAIEKFIAWAKSIPGVARAFEFSGQAFEKLKEVAVDVGEKIGAIEPESDKATKGLSALKTATFEIGAPTRAAAKAADEHAKALQRVAEAAAKRARQLSGGDEIDAALQLVDALKQAVPLQHMTAERQEEINSVMGKAIDVFKALGVQAPAAITATYLATLDLGKGLKVISGLSDDVAKKMPGRDTWERTWSRGIPIISGLGKEFQNVGEKVAVFGLEGPNAFDRVTNSVIGLRNELQQLASVSGGKFGEIVAEIANLVDAMDKARAAGERMALGGWQNVVGGGLQGAAAIGQATSTGSAKSRVAKGAATGAQIGAAFAPYTAGVSILIGAGVGALVGYIRSLGQGRKAVEEFAKAHGGFDALQARLQALGAGGEQLWKSLTQGVGRNNPEQAKQIIADVAAKMEALEKAQAKFNDGLTTALNGVMEWGGAIPDALKPYLDQLREAGRLTEENMTLLDALADGGAVDWEKMQATAEKYGIAIGGLGQAFQEQRLHAGWQELIDDADMLVRGGADVNAMLAGMADEISNLVNESIKFGTDIPENMRPYIEALIASGQLLDENGEKITDIGQLTFGDTLQTSLEKLTDEIRALIETLGGVPAALGLIPRSIDVDVNVRERRSATFEPPTGGDSHHAARGGRVTTHGIQRFSQGGLVRGMRSIDADDPFWQQFGGHIGRPFGTDTEIAMVTPGELILNDNQQKAVGALVASALGGASFSAPTTGGALRMADGAGRHGQGGPVTVNVTNDFSNAYIDSEQTATRMVDRMIPAIKKAITNDQRGLRNHLEVVLS